ncbi:MAG: hypothetical protein LBJ19_01090, partial [Holosporaceae bacterium]|nr:hypothetical protein [Holosporaceae bacterium]
MLRILFIPFIIFVVGDSVAEFLGGSSNQIQPLKRIYLHQSKDQYNLGVDFNENVKFFPRIHSSASDISLILSFNRNIVAPPPKLINHPVVK